MPFNTITFLYVFLPVVLLLHMLTRGTARNIILFLFSLVFYAWAGVSFTLIILFAAAWNFFSGKWIEKKSDRKNHKAILIVSILVNVILLCVFKYMIFFTNNLNPLLSLFGTHIFTLKKIILPLGISFFTFQNIAYLCDVYWGRIKAERNFFIYTLSVIFFPKIIAGPIIRHQEIEGQIRNRRVSIDDFVYGLRRFVTGLAKKIIVADILAVISDQVFGLSPSNQSFLLCWLGVMVFTLQVYIDFSGYSDMAIGICRMLGFRISENFNFPYLAKSLTEFWRRWHMTLSSWLRDYIFTPLSIRYRYIGKTGMALSLIITFFICGFWHGAGWTFIIWGIVHGIILTAESLWYGKKLMKSWRIIGHVYLLFVIMITWILFRSDTLYTAGHFIKTIFSFSVSKADTAKTIVFLNNEMILIIAIALLGVFGVYRRIGDALRKILSHASEPVSATIKVMFTVVEIVAMAGVMLVSSAYLSTLSYNPFIYFRF